VNDKDHPKDNAHAKTPNHLVDHGKEFMEWMKREEGAFFHPNLVIRRLGSNESSPYYGMYATDDIQANDLLMEIPRSMVFHPDPLNVGDRVTVSRDDGEFRGKVTAVNLKKRTYDILYDDWSIDKDMEDQFVTHEGSEYHCATAHKLVRELRLGDKSRYATYVNYLLTQPSGQLPTSWAKASQALLAEVLGVDENGNQILPPHDPFGWIENDWYKGCKGGSDPLEENAYMMVIQRGWDEVLIPGKCTICREFLIFLVLTSRIRVRYLISSVDLLKRLFGLLFVPPSISI
jgi:hypothetical protein